MCYLRSKARLDRPINTLLRKAIDHVLTYVRPVFVYFSSSHSLIDSILLRYGFK
jgi:hypothetical protein